MRVLFHSVINELVYINTMIHYCISGQQKEENIVNPLYLIGIPIIHASNLCNAFFKWYKTLQLSEISLNYFVLLFPEIHINYSWIHENSTLPFVPLSNRFFSSFLSLLFYELLKSVINEKKIQFKIVFLALDYLKAKYLFMLRHFRPL